MTPVECPTCGALVGNLDKHRRDHQEREDLAAAVMELLSQTVKL
jgi:DNA-directed RNA polymerase subunit N (RpoN/RPB10)